MVGLEDHRGICYGEAHRIMQGMGLQKRGKYCKAEYVQRRVCLVNEQSSLHENVVFSVSARIGNTTYIIFIMWNSISGLESWNHFRFNISCGVAVTVRGHKKNKTQVIFQARAGGGPKKNFEGRGNF